MTDEDKRHSRHRRAIAVLIGVAAGVGSLAALRFVPPVEHSLGPATVSATGRLGTGRTTVFVPPLGTVSAETHTSPLGLSMTVTQIDPSGIGQAVSGEVSREFLERDLEADLRSTALRVAIQLEIGGLVLGLLLAAAFPHRRRATVLAGGIGGATTVAVALAFTAATFDVEAFQQPRFSGALERAPQVIEALNREVSSLDELRSRYGIASERLSELLTLVAEPDRDPQQDSVAILHVSDIHSNPIGVEITNQLARRFEVDAVIDTGDITSFGAPVEARIGDLIKDIPVPYLLVPGNHDSRSNRRALSQVENVTLLDDKVAVVDGVEVLGWADPTFTASAEISTEEGNDIRGETAEDVALEVAEQQPHVLAVHDIRLAADSIGEVPLILAGHTHEASLVEEDGSILLTVGSTGATGLGSFIVESDLAYEAEIIYFRAGVAVAYDYVTLGSFGSEFQIERRLLAEEAEEEAGASGRGRFPGK